MKAIHLKSDLSCSSHGQARRGVPDHFERCRQLNPCSSRADVMVVTDHINLTGRNPLLGPTWIVSVPLPDMSQAYDPSSAAVGAEGPGSWYFPQAKGFTWGSWGRFGDPC
jgi:hypothetical protein